MRNPLVEATAHGAGIAPGEGAKMPTRAPLAPQIPIDLPRTEFVYEALVDLGEGFLKLGKGPLGERTLVPITGGKFAGPRISGTVLGGGADRQLIRADGATLLNALYEMKTDDGAIISVNNRMLVTKRADGAPYCFSQLEITAPAGPHDWLNHLVFVGDLYFDEAHPEVVLIRVYSLN
ncbi:MAG TPA: DUF3237 domain-containing protein [Roseiarcus sp.]